MKVILPNNSSTIVGAELLTRPRTFCRYSSYYFARAAVTRYHILDGLNKGRSFLSRILLKAGSQKSRCQQIWFLLRLLLAVSSHSLSSTCVLPWCLSRFPALTKTSHIGLGPTLMALFQLSHLFKGPVFK